MNRTAFIGLDLYYSQEFVDDKNKEIERLYKEIERLNNMKKDYYKRMNKVLDYIKNPNIDVLTIRYNDIVNVKDELLKIIEEVD